jgi:hypothetical protein
VYEGLLNALGRQGMKATGICPFNENWIQEHPKAFETSDNVFRTSKGSSNANLAALAIRENVESLPAVQCLSTSRGLINHPNFQAILGMINEQSGHSVVDVERLFYRVSTGEYNNNYVNNIYNVPWFEKCLREFKELGDDEMEDSDSEYDTDREDNNDEVKKRMITIP